MGQPGEKGSEGKLPQPKRKNSFMGCEAERIAQALEQGKTNKEPGNQANKCWQGISCECGKNPALWENLAKLLQEGNIKPWLNLTDKTACHEGKAREKKPSRLTFELK